MNPRISVYCTRIFLAAFAKLRKATVSLVISVCLPVRRPIYPSAWIILAPTQQISAEFDVLVFFLKIYRENPIFIKI
jgi:hypothetical protein